MTLMTILVKKRNNDFLSIKNLENVTHQISRHPLIEHEQGKIGGHKMVEGIGGMRTRGHDQFTVQAILGRNGENFRISSLATL